MRLERPPEVPLVLQSQARAAELAPKPAPPALVQQVEFAAGAAAEGWVGPSSAGD